MATTPTILLAFTRRYWLARRVALGVRDYARTHTPWHLLLMTAEHEETLPEPEAVGAAGVLVCTDERSTQKYARCPQPVVVIDADVLQGIRPRVEVDRTAVGAMAVLHFLGRGHRSLACVPAGSASSAAFRDVCRGVTNVMPDKVQFEAYPDDLHLAARPYHQTLATLAAWLRGLSRPVAVLAGDDAHAAAVIAAAGIARLRVPEEVSVLGVNDEATYRELGPVALSSISLAGERMGYEAATMLHALLEGCSLPSDVVRVPPAEVVTRLSTDYGAVADPRLRQVLTWMGQHLHERIRVRDLLRVAQMSRSSLERRFRELLDRTPHEELLRQRIERCRRLLLDTDWDLQRVAVEVGFSGREYLGAAFKQATGETPIAYRERHGRRASRGPRRGDAATTS